MSHTILNPIKLPPPSTPYIHDDSGPSDPNLDVLGSLFVAGSPGPPCVPGVQLATGQMALLLRRVVIYNEDCVAAAGDENDMQIRRGFFSELGALEASLYPRLRYRENPAPQTLHLQYVLGLSPLSPTPPAKGKLTIT